MASFNVDTSTTRFPSGAAETHYRTLPEPGPAERYRAARTVAHHAVDVVDCAELLDMLGLTPQDGLTQEDT